jgi:murein DD-endopeptidase MepM/ murein hydrolase activator NlpD
VSRAYAATFAGAFFSALIYSTKPDSTAVMNAAPAVGVLSPVDTVKPQPDSSLPRHLESVDDSAGLPVDTASAAVVYPGDIDALRAQSPVVPVAGVAAKDLVDSFDDRRGDARQHNALDIMAARNTPAIAAVAGTILRLHNSTAGGLSIYLKDRTSRFILMYGHLDSYRPGLVEGASVRRGEIIGFVGTTGNASPQAPHLHFQVMRSDNMRDWWRGTPINPYLIYRPAG